jgi:hypothetical protein
VRFLSRCCIGGASSNQHYARAKKGYTLFMKCVNVFLQRSHLTCTLFDHKMPFMCKFSLRFDLLCKPFLIFFTPCVPVTGVSWPGRWGADLGGEALRDGGAHRQGHPPPRRHRHAHPGPAGPAARVTVTAGRRAACTAQRPAGCRPSSGWARRAAARRARSRLLLSLRNAGPLLAPPPAIVPGSGSDAAAGMRMPSGSRSSRL